jgi:hypothetical protein
MGAGHRLPAGQLQLGHEHGHVGFELQRQRYLQPGNDDYVRSLRVQGRDGVLAELHGQR